MKRIVFAITAFIGLIVIASCNDYETYGDKKEKERENISKFISDSSFIIIPEEQFHEQGDSTGPKEFVYLTNSGVYLQIVRRGCGDYIQDGEQLNLLCRYTEMNLNDTTKGTTNAYYYVYDEDRIYVSRTGSTYTASFTEGLMYSTYGASVPTGWLAPLPYIKIGRQEKATDELAKVRLIVPHTQGHSTATSYVYPYFYDITFQRER